jgi:gamma-glutamylputrescine oxidase
VSTSFWLDRSTSKTAQTYDVIVVGAGIAGVSTAYWLNQEDPSLRVAVIEKHRLGFGASGRNAGFMTCGSVEHFNRMVHKHGREEAAAIWKYAEENQKLVKEHIIQDRAADFQFDDKGTFSLATSESEMTELKNASDLMKSFGIQVDAVSAADIRERLSVEGFVGGIKYLDDASVHPLFLLRGIVAKAECDLIEQTEVHSIGPSDRGTRIVKTDNGDFEAPVVIMALNGYLPTLHPYFADKVFPTRGQILVTEPVPKFMEGPCYANFYLDYFRQLPTGQILIGGFRQLEKATEVGYSDHTTDVIQEALFSFIQQHLPKAQGKKITHRWAGIMGFSKDGQAMAGSLPEDGQVFFIGGFTGHGMGHGFHAGKSVVDLVFGREIPTWLSARRFS